MQFLRIHNQNSSLFNYLVIPQYFKVKHTIFVLTKDKLCDLKCKGTSTRISLPKAIQIEAYLQATIPDQINRIIPFLEVSKAS